MKVVVTGGFGLICSDVDIEALKARARFVVVDTAESAAAVRAPVELQEGDWF